MNKAPPPQVGFNNNVKHRGRVFHIQTEDSGIKHPHITTHLFVDGGRIIKSERTDYSEFVHQGDLPTLLRKRMKEQHKAMFVALRRGKLDHLIDMLFDPGLFESGKGTAASQPSPSSDPPERDAPSSNPTKRSRPPVSFQRPRAPSAVLGIDDPKRERTPVPPEAAVADGAERTPREPGAPRPPAFQDTGSPSLYGDAKISEQSLDDVILSYISDDLQAPPEKS